MENKRTTSQEKLNNELKTLVMKFGGTSVGTTDAMRQVVSIVRDTTAMYTRLVVVTSALSKVTDTLLESAKRATKGDTEYLDEHAVILKDRHFKLIDDLISDEQSKKATQEEIERLINGFVQFVQAIHVLGEASPRALDTIAGLGERLSVRILAAAIEAAGMPAKAIESTDLIITDANFQSANVLWEETKSHTRQTLNPLLDQGIIPVVTGFIGATKEGLLTTLGRGGSDYSAAILGSVLPSNEVWIWSDVDGVMTVDPRLAPDARSIPVLSFKEISELAYYGAKVLHPKTIRPVVEAAITVRVLNTFNPTHPGTRIIRDTVNTVNGVVKAVAVIPGLKMITIDGRGMLGVPGVAAHAFGAVAATGTSVPLITQASSEQSICFAVPAEAADMVLSALCEAFSAELANHNIDNIWATEEVVIITVVGDGMRQTAGVSGRVFGALGEAKINVIAIAQGSSEVSISLVVSADDAKKAVLALHALIVKSL